MPTRHRRTSGYVCVNDRYCPQGDRFATLAEFQAMCKAVFGHAATLTRHVGGEYVDEHGQVVLRPVAGARRNGARRPSKQIVDVKEIHYGFTTRYLVTYADGSTENVFYYSKDFEPFLTRRNPAKAFVLGRKEGVKTVVVSQHATRQSAEEALLKKIDSLPPGSTGSQFGVYDTSAGWQVAEVAGRKMLLDRRRNPGFGDYIAAGRRHLATGLSAAAEEAQRAATRAKAAAEREAKRRRCDAPTPEQALRVLAQAIGVEKLNPRRNGSALFGWAKVQGGRVVKLSRAQRKPAGPGWGEVNTSTTQIGDRAYLDGGTVYLR